MGKNPYGSAKLMEDKPDRRAGTAWKAFRAGVKPGLRIISSVFRKMENSEYGYSTCLENRSAPERESGSIPVFSVMYNE